MRRAPSASRMIVSTRSLSAGGAARRRQDLRGEFDLLRRCRGLAGVPAALELIEADGRQILVLNECPDSRSAGSSSLAGLRPGAAAPAPSGLGAWRGAACATTTCGPRTSWSRRTAAFTSSTSIRRAPAACSSVCSPALGLAGRRRAGVQRAACAAARAHPGAAFAPAHSGAAGATARKASVSPLPSPPAGAGASARALHEAWRIAAAGERQRAGPAGRLLRAGMAKASACRANAPGRRVGASCATSPLMPTAACSSSAATWRCSRSSC